MSSIESRIKSIASQGDICVRAYWDADGCMLTMYAAGVPVRTGEPARKNARGDYVLPMTFKGNRSETVVGVDLEDAVTQLEALLRARPYDPEAVERCGDMTMEVE